MNAPAQDSVTPQVGMLATLRNRRGIVSGVDAFDGADGRLHLVTVEYVDHDGESEERILWETEPGARLITPAALPDVGNQPPMKQSEFDALVRATRWSAISPFVDPDGPNGPLDKFPLSAPLHGAIQVEDYQMLPLVKAMQMPRIALMIADDVGLGKTVEAGLILSELIIRRRLRKILILAPASLKNQWQEEMLDKFSVHFDVVDRDNSLDLKKRLGLDANPWRSFQRAVTSYHYLKQPDVLEQFLAASRTSEASAHLPWDLLIVDEAHNLAPSPFGEESDLAKMLSVIAPLFEHKLFLTATPHNGHTACFTGLLEKLDPVRFHKTSELKGAARDRVPQVVVRRLKREINERSNPKRFSDRAIKSLNLDLDAHEKDLSVAFQAFRTKVRALIAQASKSEQTAGAFAVEILGKRLLSCPAAFAHSWKRYLDGLALATEGALEEVRAAERSMREDLDDDREVESRNDMAASTVGAWLKPFAPHLKAEMTAVADALRMLGLAPEDLQNGIPKAKEDSRLQALDTLIDTWLRDGKTWRSDERLVVFTEYKTTLDYLQAHLRKRFGEDTLSVRILFGGMDSDEREEIKYAFNNPADPVRILLATDAASEGLNLQSSARLLLHYDVPWNPSRLEQRNGRLDRHGQARDVIVHHFESDDDADLRFLGYIVRKVDSIREDLGAVEDVFDLALEQRFIYGEDDRNLQSSLDGALSRKSHHDDLHVDNRASAQADGASDQAESERIQALRNELDLSPQTLRATLETAMGPASRNPIPRLEAAGTEGKFKLVMPVPNNWESLVDDTLRVFLRKGHRGAVKQLSFDPQVFVQILGGRPIFRPAGDTALMHLAHPMFHKALTTFARLRFPASSDQVATRWLVTQGHVPAEVQAVVRVTLEELAVNELRESFHHWVRTVQFPIVNGSLGSAWEHVSAANLSRGIECPGRQAEARDLWTEVDTEVRKAVQKHAQNLTHELRTALDKEREKALQDEDHRFKSRQAEISNYLREASIEKLRRELEDEEKQLKELWIKIDMFGQNERLRELEKRKLELEEELRRRKGHFEDLQEQLSHERERVMNRLIPKRFTLKDTARCFPVTVEICLAGGAQ